MLAVTGATAANKIYDATIVAALGGGAQVSGIAGDDVTLAGSASGVFANKSIGTAKAVTVSGYTLAGADSGNYSIVQPSGLTANITAADLAVTGISAVNKIYDTTTAATLSGTAAVAALLSDDVFIAANGSGVFADKNVGIEKIVTASGFTLGGVDAGNYRILQPAPLTANIAAASLAVNGVSANNKIYDANTTAALSGAASVAGLNGEDVFVTGAGSGLFASKNAANGIAVGVSGFTLGGTQAGNYVIAQPSGLTANITRANLGVTGVIANDKVYDATRAATLGGAARVAGFAGDDVSVTGAGVGLFDNADIGNDKPVAASGFALRGADAGNYLVAQPINLFADIVAIGVELPPPIPLVIELPPQTAPSAGLPPEPPRVFNAAAPTFCLSKPMRGYDRPMCRLAPMSGLSGMTSVRRLPPLTVANGGVRLPLAQGE